MEVWLIGHYQCMDAKLGTFTGEFDASMDESKLIYSDEYISCLYKTGQMFQKLKLRKEEVVVLKAIILTFTGIHLNTAVSLYLRLYCTCLLSNGLKHVDLQ